MFSYDKWFDDGVLILTSHTDIRRKAIYRGWMMNPEQYEYFYDLLLKQNIELITNPEEYKLMHLFTNVYPYFGKDTAKMKVYPLHQEIKVKDLKDFDKFMVKDYVKSVKGTKFPKYFDQSVTQEEFDKWMEIFYQYRGSLLTGGICIKEYLSLKYYEGKTNEYRVVYMNHQVISVCQNSKQPEYASVVPQELINKYKNLNSKYYTIDYAECEDGSWKVIEAGDGSVSGLAEKK